MRVYWEMLSGETGKGVKEAGWGRGVTELQCVVSYGA